MATREEIRNRLKEMDANPAQSLDDMTPAELLEAAARKALLRSIEVLEDPGAETKALTAVINSVLSATIRTQEAMLQHRKMDALERLEQLWIAHKAEEAARKLLA